MTLYVSNWNKTWHALLFFDIRKSVVNIMCQEIEECIITAFFNGGDGQYVFFSLF
jgi:hypothetical protein